MALQPQTQSKITAIATSFGVIAIILFLIIALDSVLTLLTIAFILAYIINPLIDKLQLKYNINRNIPSLVVSILALLIIGLLPWVIGQMLVPQLKEVAAHFPDMVNMCNTKLLAPFNAKFSTNFQLKTLSLRELLPNSLNGANLSVAKFAPLARGSITAFAQLVNLILFPLVLFYVTREWHTILDFIDRQIPRRYIEGCHNLFYDINRSLSYYLRGQILVMIVMAVIYAIALNLTGMPGATLIGALTGFLVFIPYLGLAIGAILSLLIAFSHFTGAGQIVQILLALGISNLIENFIVTPYLVGDSIGLNPVMIIFALVIFGNLFGIAGLILSLPLTAIAVVVLKHAQKAYHGSEFYKRRML